MRPCSLGSAAYGKRLARSIVSAAGQVLLRAGTVLAPSNIKALRRWGYRTVMVENELLPGFEIPEAFCEDTRAEALAVLTRTIARVQLDGEIDVRSIKGVVNATLTKLLDDLDIVFSLSSIRSVDEYTFNHSLDVCVYSLILGRDRGYTRDDLFQLGMGAIMHDFGKIRMTDIIQKRGSLTESEWEVMREHPHIGYELLRHNFEVSLLSAYVAFQHHERWNGTGYPRGLKGSEIHEFGLICAVADVWSALTADRPYRNAVNPVEGVDTLLQMSGTMLEEDMVRRFLSRVARYPTGSIVLLDDMRIGVICEQDQANPERPVVKVVVDEMRNLISPMEIRLVDHPGIRICRILRDWPPAVREKIARRDREIEEAGEDSECPIRLARLSARS